MSGDERNNYRYAADTLDAYPSLFGTLYEPKYNSTFDGHGPAFVAIAGILIRIIQSVFPNVFTTDLWHFSYFVTFQLAGLCVYWLTRRWFTKWTAWGILILFSTQPVLLGHSFINPKDIPFMFLFTLSIVLGFRLVDSVAANKSFVSLEEPVSALTNKFQEADARSRKKFSIYLALGLTAALALVVFSNQINSLVEQVVTFFYTAKPDSWAGADIQFLSQPRFGRISRGLCDQGSETIRSPRTGTPDRRCIFFPGLFWTFGKQYNFARLFSIGRGNNGTNLGNPL